MTPLRGFVSPAYPVTPSRRSRSAASRPPRRPRGAPPGNLNALKHGLYSRQLAAADAAALAALDDNFDLLDEAGVLRLCIRRLLALAGAPASLPQAVSLVSTLSLASLTLQRLLLTRQVLRRLARRSQLRVLNTVGRFYVNLVPLIKFLALTPRPAPHPILERLRKWKQN